MSFILHSPDTCDRIVDRWERKHEKVQIQDFIDYRYLGSLQVSPDQQHAVFTVITGDQDADKYPGNLWLLDLATRETRQLTSGNEEKKAIWWNDDTIVFTGCRDPKLKGKPRTVKA